MITKNVHILYKRYFLACVPLGIAIHMLGALDVLLAFLTGYIGWAAKGKSEEEAYIEIVAPSGIKYSYVYEAIMYGFLLMCALCYVPRAFFYLFFVQGGLRIKRLHWYLGVKSASYFVLCLLALSTLIISFIFSTMLTNTFGTSVAYMLSLLMIPVLALLALDLYLCVTAKQCLEERIWRAQPKITHKHKGLNNDDDDERKTEIEDTDYSRDA